MARFPSFSCLNNILSVCMLSHLSLVQLFVTMWTIAHQAPLSLGFPWQEYWSGMPCPPPGDLPDPWIEPVSLKSPALAGRLFTTSTTWEAHSPSLLTSFFKSICSFVFHFFLILKIFHTSKIIIMFVMICDQESLMLQL